VHFGHDTFKPHPLCPPLLARRSAGEGEELGKRGSAPLRRPIFSKYSGEYERGATPLKKISPFPYVFI